MGIQYVHIIIWLVTAASVYVKNWNLEPRNELHVIPRFTRGSFAVRDHLRSNFGIISGLGIICGRGSFAALYSFFFSSSSSWQSHIVTQVVISYTYIVANGSSCCFFIRIQGCICRNMEGFMRWTSRLLHKMHKPSTVSTGRDLCMTSCEFDERAQEVKICCQSRPALYYSQQQVDR